MIKFYHSGQAGAPSLVTGVPNLLIRFLNTILVVGFGLQAVDSITRTGTVATCTILAGHTFDEHTVLVISGAEQVEYNIEVRIFGCTANTFKFNMPTSASLIVTGILTCRVAPAGWSKIDEVVNKAVFQYSGGNQHFLYINEETCTEFNDVYGGYTQGNAPYEVAKIYMAEACSDVDTYGRRSRHAYLRKVNCDKVVDPRASKWFLVATEKGFILGVGSVYDISEYGYDLTYFGEFNSFSTTDTYNLLISSAYDYYGYVYWNMYYQRWQGIEYCDASNKTALFYKANSDPGTETQCMYILRNYQEQAVDASFRFTRCLVSSAENRMGTDYGDLPFISPVDGSIILNSIFIKESGTLRGKMAGVYSPINKPDGVWKENLQIVPGLTVNGTQRDILFAKLYTGCVAIDLTGPWYD